MPPVSRLTKRKQKLNGLASKQEMLHGDVSPSDAYRGLVSMSSTRFRADVEFHEEPRQVTFAVILVSLVVAISVYNAGNVNDLASAYKFATAGGCVGLVIYIMLQCKDGLMIRPHPMLWRAIHGMTLCYYCMLVILIILPPNLGIQIFHELFPASNGGASAVLAEIVSPSRISAPLDCRINYDTVLRQLSSVWFTAHTVGFWAKMCLFRDWSICLTYSLTFEVAELLLGWLVPEFRECWWDSIFMDVLGANLIGMYSGHLTLKWLSCRNYVWESEDAKGSVLSQIGHIVNRFTPFTWSAYAWPKDFEHSWLVSIGWISALLLELTSFGVIHALHINPAHFSNAARQLLLAAQGAQAVPEWYEYVRGNTSRIGHNCWLLYMIASLEIVLAIRYGKGGKSYGPFVIPVDILWIMGAFVSLWCLWMAVTYYKNRIGRPLSSKWSLALRVFAYSPLVFLARRWAY